MPYHIYIYSRDILLTGTSRVSCAIPWNKFKETWENCKLLRRKVRRIMGWHIIGMSYINIKQEKKLFDERADEIMKNKLI